MNFPKLQQLTEAKKPTKEELPMDDAPAEKSAVDKTAVLAFLKSCDAACRADVKSKLDKMVEKDLEEKQTVKEAKEVSEWEFLMGVDEGSVRRTRGDAKTVMAKMIKTFKHDCSLSGEEEAAECKKLMPKLEAAADPKKLFSMMVKSNLAWDGYDLALNWDGGNQEWRPSATRY